MPSSAAPSSSARVVLISGANKGIGYEAAKLLSSQLPQATILLGTRQLDNGQQAVQRMKKEAAGSSSSSGPSSGHSFDNVKPIELDVTKQTSLDQAAQHVKAEYGSLDVLLCNAGVSGGSGETPETVFATNIDGVHNMIAAFQPLMPAATGLIVVVASEVGSWNTYEQPAELQRTLTSSESVTWPLIQQLQGDWLKKDKGQQSEQPWCDTKYPLTGPYTTSKALLLAHLRSYVKQHPEPKLVIVCPGYCATDLNHNSGPRPASKGGESVCWPVLHAAEAEHGQFYQDGHAHPFIMPAPDAIKEQFKQMAKKQAEH